MSLPQPRNVFTARRPIDLNVSAKVTETISELIKEQTARASRGFVRVTYIDSSAWRPD
jgi:hypothetical protein